MFNIKVTIEKLFDQGQMHFSPRNMAEELGVSQFDLEFIEEFCQVAEGYFPGHTWCRKTVLENPHRGFWLY